MADQANDSDLTHKARTLVAYTLNLAKGAILADFEVDNIIALSKDVGLDISMYRDQMLSYAASLSGSRKAFDAVVERAVGAEQELARLRARPWWRRLWL